MVDQTSTEQASAASVGVSVNARRAAHGLPEYVGKEDRAQALHLACLTLQTNQASEQLTGQIIKRANVFLKYIQEGTT